MDTSELDYDLTDERIAQVPVEPRDAARLLVDAGPSVEHRYVRDLPELLEPGDVVVVNTTRVLPARLHLVKETGGQAEVLLLEERSDLGEGCWEALVRPGRRLPPGTTLTHPATPDVLRVEVGDELDGGVRLVTLSCQGRLDLRDGIEAVGEVPLPPYIRAPITDPDRYQTVYADRWRSESVAAPTAGLHLTESVLDGLRGRGAQVVGVHLVIGLGTFRPIATDKVEDHAMHDEGYQVPDETLSACRAARDRGNRVVAVGTTAVRALESAMATGALEGRTELFIRDPYDFQLVDRLLTNFHLPRSSLLAMIDAFVGADPDGARRWRSLYNVALAEDYRFLSFGDAMLLTRPGAR
jgi:S-adenosylmethionine:tRNA ribosyltransferase-isomerase